MNAIELFKKVVSNGITNYEPTGVYYCGKCGILYRTQGSAEECCADRYCKCGKIIEEKYYLICADCRNNDLIKEKRERLDKSKLVEDYDGWLYCEKSDAYYQEEDELIDYFYDNGEESPEFAYCCDTYSPEIDYDLMIENCIESTKCEDLEEDQLHGTEELKIAIDKFNEANKTIKLQMVDYGRKVKINDPGRNAEGPRSNIA